MIDNEEFDHLSVWIEEQLELYDRQQEDLLEQNRNLKNYIKELKSRVGPLEGFTEQKQKLVYDFLKSTVDPTGAYYKVTLEEVLKEVEMKLGSKVAAIDSAGGINYASKGLEYDSYLTEFIHGSGGIISNWDKEQNTDNALVIRGLGGGSCKAIQHCWATGRTFYAIDTGYWGNGKNKTVHRVTKNALQYLGPIVERDGDRARQFGYKFKKFKPGSKILLVPPSNKVMNMFGQPDPEIWVQQVIEELKKYTDRPVEVRLKPSRTDRVSTNTIQAALADDVHCLVTYNSIAAVEALMEGKPAIVLGQNAASVVAETSLANVEDPQTPNKDEMDAYMANLAYQQFTISEFRSGFAWKTINEGS
jgi:hypothetical protein